MSSQPETAAPDETHAPPRVASIVLTRNNLADTDECLHTLLAVDYPAHRVFLVDNGSDDGSLGELRRDWGERVTFIETGANLGGAAGWNAGLRAALAAGFDYFLVLNNDIAVDPDLIRPLLAVFASHPSTALVSPVILEYPVRPEGTRRIRHEGTRRASDRVWYAGGTYDPLLGLTRHPGMGASWEDSGLRAAVGQSGSKHPLTLSPSMGEREQDHIGEHQMMEAEADSGSLSLAKPALRELEGEEGWGEGRGLEHTSEPRAEGLASVRPEALEGQAVAAPEIKSEPTRAYPGQRDPHPNPLPSQGRGTGSHPTDYAPLCAAMVSRQALEAVGLLDEWFFFGHEDVDWCLRARQAGYTCRVLGRALVRHKVSASSGVRGTLAFTPFSAYHFAAGSIKLGRKHNRGLALLPYLVGQFCGRLPLYSLRMAQAGQFRAIGSYLKGLVAGTRARRRA